MIYKLIRHSYNLAGLVYWKILGLNVKTLHIKSPIWIDNPKRVIIGRSTYLGPYVYITIQGANGYLEVGSGCEINPFSNLLCGNGVEIGNNVLMGPSLSVVSSTNSYTPDWIIAKNPHIGGKITIEDNVHIGANVTVLPGITIGEGAVIGAGSIVTRDIPRGTVAYGVPCKPMRRRG